jgi:hypothetical protein
MFRLWNIMIAGLCGRELATLSQKNHSNRRKMHEKICSMKKYGLQKTQTGRKTKTWP